MKLNEIVGRSVFERNSLRGDSECPSVCVCLYVTKKHVQKSNGRKCCFQVHRTFTRRVRCARVWISGTHINFNLLKSETSNIRMNSAKVSAEFKLLDLNIDLLWHRFYVILLLLLLYSESLTIFIFKPLCFLSHYTIQPRNTISFIALLYMYHLTFDSH